MDSDLAVAVLRAIRDEAPEHDALIDRLATAVLESDLVRLAAEVREGGPFKVARAIRLASAVYRLLGADATGAGEPAARRGSR